MRGSCQSSQNHVLYEKLFLSHKIMIFARVNSQRVD